MMMQKMIPGRVAFKIMRVLSLGIALLHGLPDAVSVYAQQDDYPFRNVELPVDQRIDDLINRLTLEEKAGFLWELSPAVERLNIDKYYHGNEALHGVVRPGRFTVFPQAIAFGATFNPELIYQVATAISDEARGRWNQLNHGKDQTRFHSDLLTFWSPTVNMARDPRWGRTAETYGEDPCLTSRIGVSFVKGLQGNDPDYLKVVSTPKHYVANNVEENRLGANSVISEKALREYYLPAFRACIMEGNATAIMAAYNALNYVPAVANRWLLKDVLRGEWGFDGYVVSDCGGPCHLEVSHEFVPSREDAAAASIRAGMDLECSGGCFIIRDHLQKAIELGKLTIEEVDQALRNILKARFRLGIFDPPEANSYSRISPDVIGCKAHRQLALEVALQSTVLLKNENEILPLKPEEVKSIAIIGHNADETIFGDYSGVPFNDPVSPYQGIKNFVGTGLKFDFVDTKIRMHDLTLIPGRFLQTENGQPGLSGAYFPGKSLEGEYLQRTDEQIDLHSRENPPDPYMQAGAKSARWEGYLLPPVSGSYDLGVSSDDGFRLWIDDELILDQWTDQGETLTRTNKMFRKDRKYHVRLEWYDGGGEFACRLLWKMPGALSNSYTKEVAAARENDLVIAVIGTGLYNEREGQDKLHLDLPGDQLDMLKAVYAVNTNVIVVLVTGSQHTIPWIKQNIPAIVNVWYPGEQGGNAIAAILFGKYNPSGRLPVTYYENINALPALNRYEISEGRTYMYYQGNPLWEFGYGLSYTTFEYHSLKTSRPYIGDEEIEVSLEVQNTGKYDGDEVIQLYLSYPGSQNNRPRRQLKDFQRVHIPKGETRQVTFTLDREAFTYWSVSKRNWDVEQGNVEILVGASSDDIRLKKLLEVN